MKQTTFTKTLLPLCIAAALSLPVQANDIYAQHDHASTKETGGFGLGMIVGAILGGPPGAIVGAAGGSWLGHHDTQRTDTIAAIDLELTEKENLITKLETELSATESELANTISRFKNEQANSDQRFTNLEFLSKRQTTTIYFGSGEVDLPVRNGDHLYELAQLLNDYPELQINMEGHADISGDDEYNQHLSELRVDTVQHILEEAGIPADRIHCESYGESQAMATEGDKQNYVFDRRVSIHVSLDSSAS